MTSPTIQYQKISMYHFYYPFFPHYNQFPFYPYNFDTSNANHYFASVQQFNLEESNANHYFASVQQFNLEEKQAKVEEVNTQYSVIGSSSQQKQLPNASITFGEQSDFQQPKETYFKPKQNKQKKVEEQKRNKKGIKIHNQRLRYVNKNFESNIIYKIFSFLWSEEKSKAYVEQILKDRTKVMLYFEFIKIVRKYSKRYIKKEYLKNLCDYQYHHIAYRIVARNAEKLKYFSMDELSKTVRKLIFIFLKKVSALSILTSKKMVADNWKDHLKKARNIYQFIFEGLSSEDYDLRMCLSYQKVQEGEKAEQKD